MDKKILTFILLTAVVLSTFLTGCSQNNIEPTITPSINNPVQNVEPIEKGSFANYNRIIEPYEGTTRLALEGTESEIQQALDGLEELKKGLKKCELITPFATYENLMLESYDYRRDGHSGFNVLQVDLKLKEIREVESAKTTSSVEEPPQITESASADASCVSTTDGGQYQTYEPTQAETTAAQSENSGGTRRSILKDVLG